LYCRCNQKPYQYQYTTFDRIYCDATENIINISMRRLIAHRSREHAPVREVTVRFHHRAHIPILPASDLFNRSVAVP